MDISGIIDKIKNNAMLATYVASAYSQFGGDLNALTDWFTSGRFMNEASLIGDPAWGLDFILAKLGLKKSEYGGIYSTLFKGSLLAYILTEIDLIPAKYKKVSTDVMWGSAIAALSLPGSRWSEGAWHSPPPTPAQQNQNDTVTGRRGAELPTNQNLNVNFGAY